MKGFVVAVSPGSCWVSTSLRCKWNFRAVSRSIDFNFLGDSFLPVFPGTAFHDVRSTFTTANPPRPPYHPQRHLRHLGRLPSLLLQSLLRLHLQLFFFELAHPNIEKGIDSVWHWTTFDVSWFSTTILSLQYMFDEYSGPELKGLPLAEEKTSVFDIYYWWKKSG